MDEPRIRGVGPNSTAVRGNESSPTADSSPRSAQERAHQTDSPVIEPSLNSRGQ